MIVNAPAGALRAGLVALVLLALAGPSLSQAQPTPNAIAMAKEIITLKGSGGIFDPIVPGIIEQTKAALLQSNPMVQSALNEVAARLRTELAPRTGELLNEAARLYAAKFTEPELRDALTFYRSPLGKKLVIEEPMIVEQAMSNAQAWSDKFAEEVFARFRAEMKKKGHNL
ncbi:MAG: uncharacterized protein QOI12_4772 [Alphaproteobacteria bacterium]|jgi:hypothetical protein|nr:uncharacterized protein [Alphaproteobacteria bacterium]